MLQNRRHAAGVIGMLASSVLFSFMAFLIGAVPQVSFFTIALYRFAVGTTVIGTLALFGKIRIEFKNYPVLFLRGFIGGISVIIFFLSFRKIGVARGTVISYLYPVFATIGGVLFLKDRVRPIVWALLGAAVAGIVLMMPWSKEAVALRGDDLLWTLVTLGGAISAGVAVVSIKKLTATDSSQAIFLAQCLIGFWIVAVPAASAGLGGTMNLGLVLVLIGVVATAAQLLMTWSYGLVSISIGSLLSMLTPIFNVGIGVIAFREHLSNGEIGGSILIILSCAGVAFLGREHTSTSEPQHEEK